jgi:hypothetical protein
VDAKSRAAGAALPRGFEARAVVEGDTAGSRVVASRRYVPFHESDADQWWEDASRPVRDLYALLRVTPAGVAPDQPAPADPTTAPDTATACAAAATARLAESIVGVPEYARLRIDGGPW